MVLSVTPITRVADRYLNIAVQVKASTIDPVVRVLYGVSPGHKLIARPYLIAVYRDVAQHGGIIAHVEFEAEKGQLDCERLGAIYGIPTGNTVPILPWVEHGEELQIPAPLLAELYRHAVVRGQQLRTSSAGPRWGSPARVPGEDLDHLCAEMSARAQLLRGASRH